MRLDKFLKNSRLIKRRTVAKEACDGDRVTLNGRKVKPGAEVKPGDIIEIAFGGRRIKVRALELPETVRKEDAASMYEVVE